MVAETRCFDVLAYESNSYFTTEHAIHVPVGAGDQPLPALPMPRRLRFKTASGCPSRRNVEDAERLLTPCQEDSIETPQAPRRRSTPLSLPSQPASTDGNVHELMSEKTRLEEDLKVHRDREHQLKEFFFFITIADVCPHRWL